MTAEQYACPLCDYTAGSTGSVKGHITRSTDEAHKGNSGPQMADEIERVSLDDNTPESDQTANTGDTTDTGDTDSQGEQSNGTQADRQATDGGGEAEPAVFPESSQNDTAGGTAETNTAGATPVECPRCGSTDNREPDTVLETYSRMLTDEQEQLLQSSDYVCGDCGGVFDEP